ncbi:Groucho/TLE N-terminal Q-rich domain [Trinorchestia longiramus]|nr:Groucho/TLE N-terminal Q-rich domain [Trinorchestia longiramus]
MYPAAMNAAVAAAAASRHPGPQPGQPFKFTVAESCDRMKEEFNFLQAQYHKPSSTSVLCSSVLCSGPVPQVCLCCVQAQYHKCVCVVFRPDITRVVRQIVLNVKERMFN